MNIPDQRFSGSATVLDIGGWFKPEPRATHVVDLMPWETRGVCLNLAPLPKERFSKSTWFQVDFLQPGMRLPFADKSFDLVLCGHTIEDLKDPVPLLVEMQRVGRRGIIECPSRLAEQTRGIRDRETTKPGHPHHHWIVESVGDTLQLYSIMDSHLTGWRRCVPLCFTEGLAGSGRGERVVFHSWKDRIDFQVITGPECARRAGAFVGKLDIPPLAPLKDTAWRALRRARRRWRKLPPEDMSWWPKIVETSRPYSSIPLK